MSDATQSRLRAEAQAWLDDDPDPNTRRELEALLRGGDLPALQERFAGPLQFGTAGLRGLMGAGPSRMNQATVARAAAGLARQLLADTPDARQRGVVVGRDARRLSLEFARTVAEVLTGHGLPVHFFDEPVPTPVAAFAGRHLGASATAIVTASHNPPDYNGFKVYSERGCQIVPPQDARIRAEADRAGLVRELPRLPFGDGLDRGLVTRIDSSLEGAYLDALDAQCLDPATPSAPLRIVTTALHGVGHRWVDLALRRRGFGDLHPVSSQAEPDGAFPTVAFPNPEEPGALDEALALAREVDADLVLANDPDTDRLCVAVCGVGQAGEARVLTGNEIGVLLADWVLGERARRTALPREPLVATTVVSTTMLERLAQTHGARYVETLTGFKWIWDRVLAEEIQGATFVFGFEEALGYCVGPAVRDKDGVGAAQVFAELTAAWKARGVTLSERLDALAIEHGVHVTHQASQVWPGLHGKERMDATMERLRRRPPDEIGGLTVRSRRDLGGPDADAAGLPRSDVLTYWLEGGSRLVVRPSGTEPKLKSYVQARAEVVDQDLAGAEKEAGDRATAIGSWIEREWEG